MWTPARRTSHSKITGINMELVSFVAMTQGFPLDIGAFKKYIYLFN